MDHKTRIRNLIQSIAKGAKLTFATTLALAFGATMVWGIVSALDGKTSSALADTSNGYFTNICGTINAPPGNWAEHNLNPACQGCFESGYCSGNVVRVFECAPGEQMSDIECRANGRIVGTTANFNSTFANDCKMYQIDVYTNTNWDSLTDFVVWKGYRFRDPSCQPQQPASCLYIVGPEGTVQPGQSLSYTGTINNGTPKDLKWYKTVNGVETLISDDDNTLTVSAVAPATGNMSVRLSVNGDNVSTCQKAVTVKTPNATFSCDKKWSDTPTTTVVKPGDILTYHIDYSQENLTSPLTIVDELPEGVTIINFNQITGGTNCKIASSIGNPTTLSCQSTTDGTLTFQVQIDNRFTGTTITNKAYVIYSNNISTKESCNDLTHVIAQPVVSCEDKSANVTSVKNGDTIEYTVRTKLAEIGADELVIIDDFDETKVSIDPTRVTITPGEEMVTDCAIEDRSGNKVLKCSARMFEGEGTLNPNTYTFKYTATVLGSVVNGNIDNKVIETYAIRNGTRYADSNTVDSCSNQVTVIEPKLNCNDKAADKISVKEGDIITYTVSLNLTGTPVDRLAFVDNYDESLVQIVANSWEGDLRISCADKNGELSCEAYSQLTIIDAIEEGPYTFTYQAKVIANVTKVAVNQITSATAIRRNVRFTNDNTEGACTAEVQVKENIPSVDCIEKTVSPSVNVKVGDEIAYSIKYTSLNQDGKVHIADTLNSEYFQFSRFDENSENFCSNNNNTVSCDVPENLGGIITFYVRVLKAGTNLNNTATVSGDNKNDSCSVSINIRDRIKSLECISKVANDYNLDWNEYVTFTITYKNTGETTLNGAKLFDTMPMGMEFVSSKDNACVKKIASPGSGDFVECSTNQSLETGKTATFEITAKITKKDGGVLTNKISRIESENVTGDTSKCIANVAVGLPEPKVSVTKETVTPQDRTVVLGEDAETPEDYVIYKLVITNEGPTKLAVVPVFDLFSALDYKFIDASPDETSVTTTNATTIIYWENIGALNPGESKTLMVKLQALETYYDDVNENTLPNYVTVKDVIDENGVEANEDKDQDYVKVTGSILGKKLDFIIDKSLVSENPTKGGKLVAFKIVVTNTGTAEISEIKFTDTYDVNYLTFSDFSNDISHLQNLYTIDAIKGIFVHNNLLHGYGDEKLDPNEKIEFTVSFIAKDKKGETTNWAKAVVEDMTREDYAKVTIVVEELAKTGSNILLPIAIGIVMTMILGKKVLVKEKKK